FGFNAGASVSLACNQRQSWFVTVELLYTQKGSFQKALVDSMNAFRTENIDYSVPLNNKVKYKVNLDYVEVPVLAHYEDPNTGWALGLGFSWARLVRVKELENGYVLLTNLNSGIYKKNDWCAIVDVKFKIYKNLKFNFRFQYSMIPIRKRTFYYEATGEVQSIRPQRNNALSLRLIYSFNEKYRRNTNFNPSGERKGAKWIRDID
ncbi:PorT family protein, partial [Bacteroidales bacterium OttesenSCG-928-C03]|nr:PorT family protein [Bacteroidales bacterium OttesenSCG-928-C03]